MTIAHSVADVSWPRARLGEAIEALALAADLASPSRAAELPSPTVGLEAGAAFSRWVDTTAAWLSVEAEPVSVPYADVADFLLRAGPALFVVGGGDDAGFVALLCGGKRTVTVLDPSRHRRNVRVDVLTKLLRAPLEEGFAASIDAMLARTVSPRRRGRAREALLRERIGRRGLRGFWLLRSRPGAELGRVAARSRLPQILAKMIAAHAIEYVLALLAWAAVAKGALEGRHDVGWLVAWLLLLFSVIPFQVWGAWCASRFSIGGGALLKGRLLAGALRLDPNEIRHEGAGQLLGRVIESSAVESLGFSGGFAAVLALVELAICIAVLASGSGGSIHVVLLVASVALVVFAFGRHLSRRRRWTDVRLAMTYDLVERMVGHRTRIAQEPRARWHDGEDQALERYLGASRQLDRTAIVLTFLPRVWILAAVTALVPELMFGTPKTSGLAIALGGILLGYGALTSLTSSLPLIAGASIGWANARPLVEAAARSAHAPAPTLTAADSDPRAEGALLLQASDLRFRYGSGEPVLRGCALDVRVGDRLLLQGTSGGGKSTLASLLAGLRAPDSGLLLLGGLDRRSLGDEGWRRGVVAAPQFHENHVFSATFAFNLLMGRAWPPAPEDLEEAEAVCRELELGELIDRMPAGLQQIVGETGWQLSHGERSRLHIARALLQNADLVIIDESFAALDPETLQRALRCVLARAKTVLVVAHP